MDYVTRQFINLTKKFRKDLRLLLTKHTAALEKQVEAINESTKAAHRENSPAPQVTVVNNMPDSVEVHQNASDTRNEKNYRRAVFFLSALSLGGFVIYADLVLRQYQQMIIATAATQQAANAASRAANTAQDTLREMQNENRPG